MLLTNELMFYYVSKILGYRDRPYGVDDGMGIGVRPESGYNSYVTELEDQYLRRRDVLSGPGIPSIVNERPESLRKADGGSVGRRETNVLFVDGLPSDCTRREVSRILFFRDVNYDTFTQTGRKVT